MNSILSADAYRRFWEKDPSLWSADPETQAFIRRFMGWTDIAERMLPLAGELTAWADQVRAEGFTDVLVCGMGGSSLGSLVLRDVFGAGSKLRMHILDSTDPCTVLRLRRTLPLETTLFVVASKSGTTVEPKAFEDYFWDETGHAGHQFVAITDPGSLMEAEATRRGYRKIWLGDPEIGGRFSVLSVFGLVNAALLGVDVDRFIRSALRYGAGSAESGEGHPGFRLGVWLAESALAGREKVTLLAAPSLGSFGLWAEQLVAESTGKHGNGVLPIALEPWKSVGDYSSDRVFVGLRYEDAAGALVFRLVGALGAVGHPTMDRVLEDPYDLAGEMLIWEVATAVAGAVIGVNPFDQPNVESAKILARKKLDELKSGAAEGGATDSGDLPAFLASVPEGAYLAFLAYIDETVETTAAFDRLRSGMRVASSFGYGPRYLHSTGQYHKGGPANGVFVIVVSRDQADVPIPGMGVTFGQLKRAQATGDADALRAEGRRVLVVGPEAIDGLA